MYKTVWQIRLSNWISIQLHNRIFPKSDMMAVQGFPWFQGKIFLKIHVSVVLSLGYVRLASLSKFSGKITFVHYHVWPKGKPWVFMCSNGSTYSEFEVPTKRITITKGLVLELWQGSRSQLHIFLICLKKIWCCRVTIFLLYLRFFCISELIALRK